MALRPQSEIRLCIAREVLFDSGVTETVCYAELVNRSAVVRDPYARWCGREEAPPYPDNVKEMLNRGIMKTLLFSPASYNLAETTRCIGIAKACESRFHISFMSYGGQFENLIEKEGFEIHHLEPALTPEKIDHIYKVDQGKKFGNLFSVGEITKQVESELKLFKNLDPACIITGFNFSNSISCRISNRPLIWLTHTTWMMQSLYDAGLATYVDMLDLPVLRWLPEKALLWISRKIFLLANLITRPYDKVAKLYGLPPFKTMERLYEGDYNLLAEPEEFCELNLPPSYHYIGPLIGRLDTPIPDVIQKLHRDKLIVYFAMGSSGQPKVIAKIIEGFSGKPYNVIAPVKGILSGQPVSIPSNVYITDWLPAHKVNPMADVSVIHGGIGTVMTAALSGKPVVGVSMMPEQQFNIDCLVRKGFAIRISKNSFTPAKICSAIDKLINDPDANIKAKEFQKIIEKWDNPSIILKFFEKTLYFEKNVSA
jgi:UDP:flavonoid glycosyltransferase YjiC (YdhE family)